MSLIRTLITLLLVIGYLWYNGSFDRAEKIDPAKVSIRQALNEQLPEPIPDLKSVLPQYTRPEHEAPSLVVAKLRVESNDELPWDRAITQMLLWNLKFPVDNALRLPDMFWNRLQAEFSSVAMAKEEVGRSEESLRLIHKRLGMDHVLRGKIVITDSTVDVDLELSNLPDFASSEKIRRGAPRDKLPEILNQVVIDTYTLLGWPLGEDGARYLEVNSASCFSDLKGFVEFQQHTWDGETENWNKNLQEQIDHGYVHPCFFTSYARINRAWRDSDLTAYFIDCERLFGRFGNDRGIRAAAARSLVGVTELEKLRFQNDKIRWFMEDVLNDPMLFLCLGDNLLGQDKEIESVAVYLEAVERWPDHYRIWSGLANSILQLAWKYRGADYWEETRLREKNTFGDLLVLADSAVDRGLSLHDEFAYLYDCKMRIFASGRGCEEPLFEYLEKAVRYDPKCRRYYSDAANFVQPQWGGSFEDLQRVMHLAIRNNPDSDWPYLDNLEYSLGQLTFLERRGDFSEPVLLRELAKRMVPVALEIGQRESLHEAMYSALQILVRAGADKQGAEMVEKFLENILKDKELEPLRRNYRLFLLAEYALAFNDPLLAGQCLQAYQDHKNLGNFNYRVPILKAVAEILDDTDTPDLRPLLYFIQNGSNNVFAKNWLLQLGIEHKVDEELWKRCLNDLEDWDPNRDARIIPINELGQQCFASPVAVLRDMFKVLAPAHAAARAGEYSEAAVLYREAMKVQKKDNALVEWREPFVIAPMYRTIQKMQENQVALAH